MNRQRNSLLFAAALLVPGSLALISANFPADRRGAAIGTWSAWSAITAAAGPVAGGWVASHASWRWLFFFNVPVAAVVRSGETIGPRPWMVTVLSDYGRDRLAFQSYERLLDPLLTAQRLPTQDR